MELHLSKNCNNFNWWVVPNSALTHFYALPPRHSFLIHYHSFSNPSHPLWIISSLHPPTQTHFFRVLRLYRLYALICLTYLIDLRGVILNRGIATVLSYLSAFYVFIKAFFLKLFLRHKRFLLSQMHYFQF